MQKINLYKRHDAPFQVTLASSGVGIINNPMYCEKIALYKGIENVIEISVRSQDRKPIKLENKTLMMYIQNREGTYRISKELYPVDYAWGLFQAKFTAEELEPLDAGYYKAFFLAFNDEQEPQIMYTAENWETAYSIEVIANQYDCFVPSLEITPVGWLLHQLNDTHNTHYYESDWIRANNSKNHGFAFYFNGYSVITIKGSNELQPTTEDKSWFEIDDVELDSQEPAVFNKFYQLSCEWVKFEINDIQNIEKIMYRN